MSKVTVTYKIKAKKRKPEKKPDTPPAEKSRTRPVSRAARMLALAHYRVGVVLEPALQAKRGGELSDDGDLVPAG